MMLIFDLPSFINVQKHLLGLVGYWGNQRMFLPSEIGNWDKFHQRLNLGIRFLRTKPKTSNVQTF